MKVMFLNKQQKKNNRILIDKKNLMYNYVNYAKWFHMLKLHVKHQLWMIENIAMMHILIFLRFFGFVFHLYECIECSFCVLLMWIVCFMNMYLNLAVFLNGFK